MIASVVQWMTHSIGTLLPVNFENHSNVYVFGTKSIICLLLCSWSGGEFVDVLRRGNVTMETLDIILEAVRTAEEFSEMAGMPALSPKAVLVLSNFTKLVRFLFSEDLEYVNDFQVVIQKTSSHTPGRSAWTHTLGIWCLNPRVAFHGLSEIRSAILTSGTLTPMDSYESELAAPFQLRAELGHVIDTQKQVWVGTISQSPGGEKINTTFKYSDTFAVQDGIGESLLAYAQKIPNGTLCFFPSYSFLEKVCSHTQILANISQVTQRWQTTGLWQRLRSVKSLHIEPKGAGGDFAAMLSGKVTHITISGALLFALLQNCLDSL